MLTTPSPIGLRRLNRQRIAHPSFDDAGQVAAWLGVLQGQDYLGTKWAFGLRLPHSTEAAIDQAIAAGTILRTWALRGTLHYVAPADIHWLLALIGPRLIAGNATRYRQLELDSATLTRAVDLIAAALQDGQRLARAELFAILQANGISTAGQRGVYMLQRAGLERLIYQAAMQGGETTFRALAPGPTLPPDQAVAELARRYFTSRGPATLADFAYWAGLRITEARASLAALQSTLVEDRIDGQSYWQPADEPPPPDRLIDLLPGFDEFLLGYKDRSAVLDPQFADAICPGGNGVFYPTIVSAGRIIGTWKRALKKKAVEITLQPFRPLRPDERDSLAEAAARYGRFLGLPPILT
ncbi:MAG: AlkZ family DNA glycosylase [Anaerolineae bacterium]|nr:AlkZ family DNA glycosylase [Anaerolineae bacterium]